MARHGENIRKRADERWEGRYKAFDEKQGKFVYRSVYGRRYEEVKEKLATAKAAGGKAEWAEENAHLVSFAQAAEEWLAEMFEKRKYSTYIKYKIIYQTHLSKAIGLCQVCPDASQEMQKKISDCLSGKRMSESLQKSILCVANQILKSANRKHFLSVPLLSQPAANARERKVNVFSQAEQAKIFACIYGQMDASAAAILLCLYTGIRLGELCALKWTDIDAANMTLTVNRTVQRISMPGRIRKSVLMETEPKNESSKRIIPLPKELLGILSRFQEEREYVFGGEKPLDPRTMQYRFKKLLKKAEVDYRNFHVLRHTFATNCVENCMDAKTLSELLGHSNVKITLDRYVHPTMDSKRKQMGMLSTFYGQICGQAA